MSVLRNIIDVVCNRTSLTAAVGTYTSDWFDADDLNGCQFWISYTGTATVNVSADVTPIGATQKRQFTRANWFKNYVIKNGASATEGFVAPPDPPFDRPIGGYRVKVTTDANITNLGIIVCRNSGG